MLFALRERTAAPAGPLVLDLTRVTRLDAVAEALLRTALARLAARGHPVTVVGTALRD